MFVWLRHFGAEAALQSPVHIPCSFTLACWIPCWVSNLLCTMSALVTSHLVWRSFSSPAEAVSRVPFTEVSLVFVSFSCFRLIFSVYSLVNVTFLPVNQARWSVNQCICLNADTAGRNHGSEELHSLTTIGVFFESKETSDRQRDTMGRGQTVLSVWQWRADVAEHERFLLCVNKACLHPSDGDKNTFLEIYFSSVPHK